MTSAPLDLRDLVAGVVREMVADLVADAVRDNLGAGRVADVGRSAPEPAPAPTPARSPRAPGAEHVTPPPERARSEAVRIADDADLDRFVRHLVTLLENPRNRQDVKAGRLRFRLAAASGSAPATAPAQRVERGAVTERQVKAAAEAGERLVLGARAVLTPLARERARALGVHVEKER